MTSEFHLLNDGSVEVRCLTDAVDPSTKTITSAAKDYEYFSTECEVRDAGTGDTVHVDVLGHENVAENEKAISSADGFEFLFKDLICVIGVE